MEVREYRVLVDLANKTPSILDKMARGIMLDDNEIKLLNAFKIKVQYDQPFFIKKNPRFEDPLRDKDVLERLHEDSETRESNQKSLYEAETKREKITNEYNEFREKYGNSNFQDTSDITGDGEPFDPSDPDG